jgi:hypothetical protein
MKYGAANKVDTAMTGWALSAFLAAGHTDKGGLWKDTVKRGITWLVSKQAANGCVWDATDASAHRGIGYPCAIATLALSEAAKTCSAPAVKAAAQKAIDYCTGIQQENDHGKKGGWRYRPGLKGDLCVSGWYISALKAASTAGLRVPLDSLQGAARFLDSVENKSPDETSGKIITNYIYQPGATASGRRCAIGFYCRLLLGANKKDTLAGVEHFISKWGTPKGSQDMYYWYYGTLCAFQQGGTVWEQFNAAMKEALLGTQRREGNDAGSWEPQGDYSSEWGRVGQTALACLCLEVYYRYPQLQPDPDIKK